VFEVLHRDYAEMVFHKLVPAFLGRTKDLEQLQSILSRVEGKNSHFSGLIKAEIFELKITIE